MGRRPILPLLFLLVMGILAAHNIKMTYLFLLAIVCLVFCLYKRKARLLLFLCVFLISASYFSVWENQKTVLEGYNNSEVTVFGRVLRVEEKESNLSLEVKIDLCETGSEKKKCGETLLLKLYAIDGDNIGGKGKDWRGIQSLVGKEICTRGVVSLPSSARNPGLFDYKLYLKTKGIHVILTPKVPTIQILSQGNVAATRLAELKQHFSNCLGQEMTKDARGLLLGMLFGDKTLLDEELTDAFRTNGTAHILAVSGIHVGIIYLCIRRLFQKRKTALTSLLTAIFLIFYAALSAFSPSVVRAVFMILLHLLSEHRFCRYDFTCSIAFSAFVLLLLNPYRLFNAGFQLSYLAVFTMAFLIPLVLSKVELLSCYCRYEKLYAGLKFFAPAMVIQVGMIPVTAYLFQTISLSAFFVNIPVIALASVIIPLGLLLLVLSFLGGFLFSFVATATELLLELMAFLNRTTAGFDAASLTVVAPSLVFLFLYYGILFFGSSELFWSWIREKQVKKNIAVVSFLLCLALVAPFFFGVQGNKADIVFVDVGQGDCIHVKTPNGKNILIDSGGSMNYDVGKNILKPYLLKNGVPRIDLALVTHLHQDHYEGLVSLCHELPVEVLAVYEGYQYEEAEIKNETGLSSDQLLYLKKGDHISIEKGISIDILYPEKKGEENYLLMQEGDENDMTLVIRLNYEKVSVLLTGDLGFSGEAELLKLYSGGNSKKIESAILKIGHHGSKYSSGDAFLDMVKPKVAVIQVGEKNNFGHPSPDVIDKLGKKDIMIKRTDLDGAILLDVNEGDVRIRTMI
ncbi:MAG: DNA internalization-related competence protein ComEC/Rec2 [Eubacteriales bacterium]|nr:DNA internalization-related competence protein ComEC/Rec2 [Eubacteriales bacterium]MDD3349701.1 DNA internalization-related competence protein ComEC/Rec2 [Eubacteriales bacterium]